MPSYGRGGVGNIQAVSEQAERIAADVEANENISELSRTSDVVQIQRQQYVYAGRGGAGNFYNANEINDAQPSDGTSSGGPIQTSSAPNTAIAGRGGAGNYEFAAAGNEQQIATQSMKDERTREKLNRDIVRDVSEHLAVPPKAKLASGQTHRR